ncbi:MAG: cytochrome c oxidase accessory protein CcoG [Chlorobi bacterium]|nr:cytochrome c oxidase accessory protein CcoG [Chlorobiota bacterium]
MHLTRDIIENTQDTFRDTLGIVTDEGKRKFVYPKKPKGRLHKARVVFSVFLLAILFITPFIKLSGHPFMMFNIVERKFILFGLAFGPHDFYLFVLATISFVVFIILFTVVFGRVFCGWVCPQTVFLEMVFRKIEFWIEGDYLRQKLLNDSKWTAKKISKKLVKWSVFFALSVFIANTLLAWIIGTDELYKIISEPVSMHPGGFIAMLLFSAGFYFIFAWFREYACVYVCPYGRLQSVLLDQNSIVIAYDNIRGEPRGKIKKAEVRTLGDCIDCKECIAVCPTGIDIRNGTQLECVNCTACIDACDNIMDKINKPSGLIKYASFNNVKDKTKFKLTPRITGYLVILTVLIAVLGILLYNRNPIDFMILRTPGMLYQEQPGGILSNLYSLKLTNKTFDEVPLQLRLENLQGEIKIIGSDINLEPNAVSETKFLVMLPKQKVNNVNTPIEIGIYTNGEKFQTFKSNFLGPANQN